MERSKPDVPLFVDSRTLRQHYGLNKAEIERAWGSLPTYRIGDRRRIKLRRDEFEAWLESFRKEPV